MENSENNLSNKGEKTCKSKWQSTAIMIIIISCVLIFAGYYFSSPTPEEAVKESFEDKDITPVIELYDETPDKDKMRIAYQITTRYQYIADDVFRRGEKEEILGLKEALSGLDVDNGKREYLGMLFRIKELCYDYAKDVERKENFEKYFERKYNKSISSLGILSSRSVNKRNVYIHNQMDNGKYIAYGYRYFSSIFGSDYLPDFSNCIGVIEPSSGTEVSEAGVYTMNLIYTNKDETLQNQVTGFTKKVPVYLAVPDDIYNDVWQYDKIRDIRLPKEKFQLQKETLEILKDAYDNKIIHSIKLDDVDLTTTMDVFDSKYQVQRSNEERAGFYAYYTNGFDVQCDRSRVGKLYVSYYPYDKPNKLSTNNGIQMGMDKDQVKSIMKEGQYALVGEDNAGLFYLMPNAQFICFTFRGNDGLNKIEFKRDVPYEVEDKFKNFYMSNKSK